MNNNLIIVPTITKENVGNYLQMFALLGDRLVITDAYIINIGIDFKITTVPLYNKR